MALILIVDDDEAVRGVATDFLERAGHEVRQAADGNECLKQIGLVSPEVLIIDIVMPEQSGLRTIDHLVKASAELKILAISGGGSLLNSGDYLSLALSVGAHGTLQKPFSGADLCAAVDALLESR